MSTLVQPNNSPHYPQLTMMNSGEAGARQRPTNTPSKNLFPNEQQCLYDILGTSCVVRKISRFNLIRKIKFILDFSNSSCTSFTCK